MKNAPTPYDNIIDSRDLVELLEEKESEAEALFDQWLDEIVEAERESREQRDQPFTEEDEEKFREERYSFDEWLVQSEDEEADELKSLRSFCEDIESSAGQSLRDGVTIIADSYFETYAEELAEDVCDMKEASQWPFSHINWESAADELKTDYTEVTWDGNEFWVRS